MSAPAPVRLPAELESRAREWAAADPDPATRSEVDALLAAGDEAGLRERFDRPLSFGTAGLRAPLGAGPARMNRAVVRKTTAGLARHLLDAQGPEAAEAGIVVGHDARSGSAIFAEDAARVAAAAGLRTRPMASALPTPLTAFAVRYYGAAAGVMVTASHNPAPDNGYKVYLGDGAQVVPPHDTAMAAAALASAVPTDEDLSGPFGTRLAPVDEADLLSAYRRAVMSVLNPAGPRRVRTVYTPLHGVGGRVLPALLEEAGFDPPRLVGPQAEPDPAFPTAPFPNPEEPGVMDLALEEGRRQSVDLVLANDPDADRLAVALPERVGSGFRLLSGDELGALIADHLLSRTAGDDRLVATTVVSSTMLSALAGRAGVSYAETLTGFKWIARAARARPGRRLLFGYEEALGYAVSEAVADKDGLSAALVVAEMVAAWKAAGGSLLDRWDELESALGVHSTSQWSARLPGPGALDELGALMARWRAAPPRRLAGLEVTRVRDLLGGEDDLPPSDVLIFELGPTGRVVLRPSGTEPKLKAYLEARTAPVAAEDLGDARRGCRELLGRLGQEVAAMVAAGP